MGRTPRGESFLKALAQEFHGKFKRIRGLANPVKVKS